jgi:hypothetical protein
VKRTCRLGLGMSANNPKQIEGASEQKIGNI